MDNTSDVCNGWCRTGLPKSVFRYLLFKESNFFSGILNFLADFQDFQNKATPYIGAPRYALMCADMGVFQIAEAPTYDYVYVTTLPIP